MDKSIIREAIMLLNSMVECGEKHSEVSRNIIKQALAELDKPIEYGTRNTSGKSDYEDAWLHTGL